MDTRKRKLFQSIIISHRRYMIKGFLIKKPFIFTHLIFIMNKDNLHAFIHTLTPTEKRFLKRFLVSRKEVSNDYLQLFDVFNEMKVFDNMSFHQRTSHFTFHNNIEVKKHYLFNVLLEGLRQYKDKKNGLLNSLIEIDILFEKGLYKVAHKRLTAAKKITVASDQFSVTYQLLEKELLLSRYIASIDEHKVMSEQRACLSENQNLLEYIHLYNELRRLLQENSFVRNTKQFVKFERIEKNKLIADKAEGKSLSALFYFHDIRYLYYAAIGKSELSRKASKKMHELLVKHPEKLGRFGLFYLRSVAARLSTMMLIGFEKKEFNYLISELKKIMLSNSEPEYRKIAQSYLYQFQLIAFMKTFQFSKALTLVKTAILFLKENEVLAGGNAVKYLRFDIAKTFFVTENYSEANKWFLKIDISESNNRGYDIYAFSRIISLLTDVFMNNTENIRYDAAKLRKQLIKLHALHEFESFLISRISQNFIHWHEKNKVEKIELLTNFRSELNAQLSHKWRANTVLYFDFEWWVDLQISKLTFATQEVPTRYFR
jgi:hypothetical protein